MFCRRNVNNLLICLLSMCLALRLVCFSVSADTEYENVYDVIREGFYGFSETIDISRFEILPEELTHIVSSVIKDDPYLFFVNGRVSFSYKVGGCVISLKPKYDMPREETYVAWEYCREKVREMAKLAMKYERDVDKALFLHDYICHSYSYDKALENDDILSFFESGSGTCQAYAQTYMAVLRECGIESHYVASDTIEHIWNYVKIDGEWFHADLTWDDSASAEGKVSRRHFLLSDRLAEERGHRDWYSLSEMKCKSERFSDVVFDDFMFLLHNVGDVDHNGKISLSDLLYLRKADDIGDVCLICADIDGDGVADENDMAVLRKKLVGED